MIPPPPDLRRDAFSRAQRDAFAVFLPRGLPEAYLQWLKEALSHHQIADQYPEPDEADPIRLVKRATALAKESREKGFEFDHVWCLFDGLNQAEAESLQNGKKIRVAASMPSFDLWILLHFEDVAGGMSERDIAGMLRRHLREPARDIPEGALENRYDLASNRARSLDGSDMFTNVGDFVEQVRASLLSFDPGAKPRI